MPHLVLEYSANVRENLDTAALFGTLHSTLSAAGGFRLQDFKSRAVCMNRYLIGDGTYEQSFVNLDIRTFGGKPAESRAAISEAALRVLTHAFATTLSETACDISVQVTELDRPAFARTRSEDHTTQHAVA